MDDGRMNILVRGGSPFRLLEKQEDHVYPAGKIELLGDRRRRSTRRSAARPRERYADLLEKLTNERPESAALAELSAYEMAASVDIDLDVKQGLLELRSEQERLRLLARLFKDGHRARRAGPRHLRPRGQERQGQVRNWNDRGRFVSESTGLRHYDGDAAAARVAGARQLDP